jgi:exodeoxyribonuclease V alpha subunit
MNPMVRRILNPSGEMADIKFFVGDRVIFRNNNYQFHIMNGETFEIAGHSNYGFYINQIGREEEQLLIPRSDFYKLFDLGFVTTVHKAQGNEFDAVVVVMHDEHSYLLMQGWDLFYTAVTRASKIVILVCSEKALTRALHKKGGRSRLSNLNSRILDRKNQRQQAA